MNTSRSIIRNTFYIQLTAFILLSLSSSVGSMIDGVVIGQFLGVDSIAAFGIINPLMIAFSIIGAVVAAGARNRFTRLLGAGKTEQAKKVFSLACVLSAGFAAALMLFLIVFSAPVTSALGASRNNAELLPQARGYLIGISFGLPAMNLVRVLNGIVVAVESRRIKIHREGLWNRVLLLPDTFDVLEQDKLDVTVTKMDDVMALTDSIWKFCDEHGCDSTRRNHLALSVEELAGNMIQHGFTDGKPHCIEARVLKKSDGYYVRFRNDCLIFDPLRQIRLLSDEDPTYHIGLRMIAGIAKDIRYTCVLKLNNISVKI